MQTYIKRKSEIDLVSRMDYIFWSPTKTINKEHDTVTIGECVRRENLTASAFYPSIVPYYIPHESAIESEHKPFIRVADARNGLLNYNKTVFLSADLLKDLNSSIKCVKPGDIVITKGGEYIGEATLVPDYYDEYGTCRDILCIRTKDSIVSGEYLASYLQSDHGKSELIRTKSVQGQPHLTLDKVAALDVPIYDQDFQDRIASLWESFYQMVNDSNAHLERAKYILDEALKFKMREVESSISFTQQIERKSFAQRFDFNFYERRWSKVVKLLKDEGVEFKTVNFVKDSFKATNPREIFNYITLADIDDRSGIVKKLNSMEAHKLPDRAKRLTIKGDVLVSSLRGSKEKIAIVDSELSNVVASTGFYVIRDNDYLPEVLYLIFRSEYYDLFIEEVSSGSIMSSITQKYFKQFDLPILTDEIQSEIADEVSQYITARKQAFEKLSEAITLFDEVLE